MTSKTDSSIINSDGSLCMVIPPSEVTWFSLLWATRAANSVSGGWNSKSYWNDRGLCLLANERGDASAIVDLWTKNSLRESSEPLPRRRSFQFELRREALLTKCRGKAGLSGPSASTENGLNWSLSLHLFQKLQHITERRVVYELPLADESDGQLKADVVVFHNPDRVEIVELKRKDPSDTPLMALVESICYTLQTIRCWPRICAELGFVGSATVPSDIHLMIAGPGLWDTCNPANDGSVVTKGQRTQLQGVIKGVQTAINQTFPTRLHLTLANVAEDGSTFYPINGSTLPDWSALHNSV